MSWRVLFMQAMPVAFVLALASAGKSKLARIAMMAITTSSSIRVNAPAQNRRRATSFDGVIVKERKGLCRWHWFLGLLMKTILSGRRPRSIVEFVVFVHQRGRFIFHNFTAE